MSSNVDLEEQQQAVESGGANADNTGSTAGYFPVSSTYDSLFSLSSRPRTASFEATSTSSADSSTPAQQPATLSSPPPNSTDKASSLTDETSSKAESSASLTPTTTIPDAGITSVTIMGITSITTATTTLPHLQQPRRRKQRSSNLIETRRKMPHDENSTIPPPPATLLLTNIPVDVRDQVVYDEFRKYGDILSFRIELNHKTGRSLGIAQLIYSGDPTTAGNNARKALLGAKSLSAKICPSGSLRIEFDPDGRVETAKCRKRRSSTRTAPQPIGQYGSAAIDIYTASTTVHTLPSITSSISTARPKWTATSKWATPSTSVSTSSTSSATLPSSTSITPKTVHAAPATTSPSTAPSRVTATSASAGPGIIGIS
ncbi:hypothetical protein HK102_005867, partial [Quaeritorhiza haematococci]